MAECGNEPYLDRVVLSKDREKALNADVTKMDLMEGFIKTNSMVRGALGMNPKPTGDARSEFADWARRKMFVNIFDTDNPISSGDINFLFGEMLRSIDVVRRAGKWGNGKNWHTKLNKLVYLPQEVFRRDIIGGEDLWDNAAELRAKADSRRDKHNFRVEEIGKILEKATGVTIKQIYKYLGGAEQRVDQLTDQVRTMESEGGDPADIRNARIALRNARTALDKILHNESADVPNDIGAAINAQYHITLLLEGLYETTDPIRGREFRNVEFKYEDLKEEEVMVTLDGKEQIKMRDIITKKVISSDALRKTLAAHIPKPIRTQIEGMVGEVARYMEDFKDISRNAMRAERENYIHELTRGKAQLSPEAAKRFVDEHLKFNEEDFYFPRHSFGMMNKVIRLRNEAKMNDDPVAFLTERLSREHADGGVFRRATTPAMMPRQYNNPNPLMTSRNLFRVVQAYGNDVIQYWHDNRLSVMMNKHMDMVREAWGNVKDQKEKDRLEGYIGGLNDYLKNFVEQSRGVHTGGTLAEISKILTAWKVGLTMGFLNPSTPLLNMAEGQALIFTRAWTHYFPTAQKENRGYIVGQLVEKEWTRVHADEHLMQDSQPATNGLIADADGRFARAEADTKLRWLQKTRMAVTEVAKRSIKLQRMAENMNRRKAFETGALMEYEYISPLRAVFNTTTPERESYDKLNSRVDLKSLGLSRENFKNPGGREKAWNTFVRERVLKAGYEMVYQTQWNYNMIARHFFEGNPIGKMAMMFQHYPLSWVAALRRNYDIMNSLRRAGVKGDGQRAGVKAMFQRDSRSEQLGLFTNQEAMFALISGGILMGLNGLRMGTGIVLGQMWQHPGIEVAQDMVKYVNNGFNDQPEQNKALFWGQGAMNQFTGPIFSDVMDAVSLAALKVGIEDGDMPVWMGDVLRGTVGFRPNEVLLTKFGTRQYNTAMDVMMETLLWEGMSVKPKALRVAKAIPKISEHFTGEKADLKDLSHALMRAAGVRDEAGVDKWISGQLEKDRKF